MSRPCIGLNCDVAVDGAGRETLKLGWLYVEAVRRADGVPVLLPPVGAGLLPEALARMDGLVLVGGRDYDPALYGQEAHPATRLVAPRRVAFDVALARAAVERGLPTLGVCGGAQLINVAFGGSLIQDIPSELPGALTHTWATGAEPSHDVEVAEGSRLATIVGAGRLEVNSSHHQAVAEPGRGLRVGARAPDGVVEAVEGESGAFVLGVQWHPERLLDRPEQVALFRALVAAAGHREP